MANKSCKSKRRGKKSNPVAKFARKFNRAVTHRDRTKYWRKKKWQDADQ